MTQSPLRVWCRPFVYPDRTRNPEGEEVGLRLHLAALAAGLAWAGVANAQQQASSFFTGVPATQVKSVPLDTSRALIQHPAQSALTSNRFNFSSIFRRMTTPTYPPKRGVSPLPPPSSFASTSYKNGRLVGTPPYPLSWMFGGGQSPLTPVAPVIPGQGAPVGPGS